MSNKKLLEQRIGLPNGVKAAIVRENQRTNSLWVRVEMVDGWEETYYFKRTTDVTVTLSQRIFYPDDDSESSEIDSGGVPLPCYVLRLLGEAGVGYDPDAIVENGDVVEGGAPAYRTA